MSAVSLNSCWREKASGEEKGKKSKFEKEKGETTANQEGLHKLNYKYRRKRKRT